MDFVDYVKVNVRSGGGGNGCVSFRREKFVPRGGPDGGDGGRGGDVYVQGSRGKATLLDFRYQRHYKGRRGGHGRGKDQHGRNGAPVTLTVPLGTVVRDAETGEVLLDVTDEAPHRLLRGGKGGRGNARFKTSTHRAPMEWEEGEPGTERWVVLELKLIADVGLVGFPNAGKSTLISRISAARPRIADYPFTTLVPNLGVVQGGGFETFVVADLPGIIRGAHEGAGLGHRFLRHIERTALLLLLLDPSELAGREPWEQYRVLLGELGRHDPALLDKPRAVAVTKRDLFADDAPLAGLQRRLADAGERAFVISAVRGDGLEALLRFLAGAVARSRRAGAPAPDERSAAPTPGS